MAQRERIVLIDDSANDLAVTRRFLERHGYDVATALSGEEGLELIARTPQPDAILVDYRMPVMDGFEVARRIKSDPLTKHLEICTSLGLLDGEQCRQLRAAGV